MLKFSIFKLFIDIIYYTLYLQMDYFIELAHKQALKSSMNKQYGAVLIYRNKVVGTGHNSSSKITSKNEYCIL